MKILYYWTAFIILALTSCRKTLHITNNNPFDAQAFHNRSIGASAHELLNGDVYKSIVVELQFMKGFKPKKSTLDQLRIFLETYLNKPKGINIVLKEIPAMKQDSMSMDEVLSFEKANRTRFAEEEKTAIYILFTNGLHPGNKILGMAYRNTSAVVYGQAIRKYSSMAGRLTHQELETAVLLHEVGHLLGLVNKGSHAQSGHIDSTFQDHCNNKKCLMFHSVETKNLSSILLKGNIPVLDQRCIEDLIANGGKYTPDYNLVIKPF